MVLANIEKEMPVQPSLGESQSCNEHSDQFIEVLMPELIQALVNVLSKMKPLPIITRLLSWTGRLSNEIIILTAF